MIQTLFCCAALVGLPFTAAADPIDAPHETIIRLDVQPMAAPKPALRYRLLPELKDMSPGNPIAGYLRCLAVQEGAPDAEVVGRATLRAVDEAARLDRPDWQFLLNLRTDGFFALLPDLQRLRLLAVGLDGRFRDEIAQHRINDAVRTAQTMFALSRHAAEHPTLIGALIGMAITTITIGPLEELLQQPDCPNLYWALTNLPHPFIGLEKSLEGDQVCLLAELRDLDDRAPMSKDQIRRLIAKLDQLRSSGPQSKEKLTVRTWLDVRVKDRSALQAARRRLVAAGIPEERLAQFPPDQVFLLDDKREFEVRRDEVVKLMPLPYWQVDALLSRKAPAQAPTLLDEGIGNAFVRIRLAQGRVEQRLAMLQHVEALRLYAADHDGALPATLAEIGLPLPVDPFSGKAFHYDREGATAHLRGTPPRGQEKEAAYNVHYVVTIRK
jgi:hypothetical protein